MTEDERQAVRLLQQSAKTKLEALQALTDEQFETIPDPEQEMAEAAAFVEYTRELRSRYPDDLEVIGARGAAGLIMAKTKNVFRLLK